MQVSISTPETRFRRDTKCLAQYNAMADSNIWENVGELCDLAEQICQVIARYPDRQFYVIYAIIGNVLYPLRYYTDRMVPETHASSRPMMSPAPLSSRKRRIFDLHGKFGWEFPDELESYFCTGQSDWASFGYMLHQFSSTGNVLYLNHAMAQMVLQTPI
jgi:hypothetical protein